jgi:Tfp pilus assembly protein PilO
MRQQLRQLREQLGWQGISGFVLLILASIFHFLALQPVEQEVEYMHNQLDAARVKVDAQSRSFDSGDRQNELDVFFSSLPAEQNVTDILASIFVVAEESGVELKQGEYHLDEQNKPRLEYGLSFPVQGGYANIRHFVFRILADHPAIALNQINFQRDRVNDSALKAEIRLTLFLRPNYPAPRQARNNP